MNLALGRSFQYTSGMLGYTYRMLTSQDTVLLEKATLGTINWCGERFTLTDVRNQPEFAHYTRLVTERRDLGIAAYRGDELAGIAWALYLPAEDPGYGFLNQTTPECSLWVADSHHGQGLGRKLLRALLTESERGGATQMSLSVEEGNFARKLYLGEGFTPVLGREKDGVMVYHHPPKNNPA